VNAHSAVRISAIASAAAVLVSCAASSKLTTSWSDPAATGRSYKKIAVVGITPRAPGRRMYEDAFVAALESRAVAAVASYTFAGEGKLDREAATAKLKEIGADAVLVTRLVDQETVKNFYPPSYSTVATPAMYHGGWYGYYSTGYTYMSDPGYVTEDKVYRLETNLYDLGNERLLWSGLTETTVMLGDSPTDQIVPVIQLLLYDMEKKGVLPKAPK